MQDMAQGTELTCRRRTPRRGAGFANGTATLFAVDLRCGGVGSSMAPEFDNLP
jgi:hypothetical protein